VKAGHRFKTWIKVQELSKAVEDFDQKPAIWLDVYTLRALVVPTSGGELITGSQQKSQVTHEVTFRWLPGVKTSQRILIDDESICAETDSEGDPEKRVMHIDEAINLKDRNRDIELRCIERVT